MQASALVAILALILGSSPKISAGEYKPPRGYQFEYGLAERVVLTSAYEDASGDRYTLNIVRDDKTTGYKYPEKTQNTGRRSTTEAVLSTMPGIKDLPKDQSGKINVEYKYMPWYTFEVSLNRKHPQYKALQEKVPELFNKVGEYLKKFPDYDNPRYLELRKTDPVKVKTYTSLEITVQLDLEHRLNQRPLRPNHAEWRGMRDGQGFLHFADSPVKAMTTQENGGGFFAVNHLLNEIVLEWQKANGAEYDPKDLSVLRFWFWYTYTNHEALPERVRELTQTANDHRYFLNLTSIEYKAPTGTP